MPSRLPVPARVRRAGVAAAVAVGLLTASSAALAQPAPTVESVAEQVAALDAEARAAAGRHQQAVQAVQAGEAELLAVQREAQATAARLTSARRTAGRVAAASYRQGVIDPGMLQVIFSESPEDALHQAASVALVMDQQAALVERVAAVSADLAGDEERLAVRVAELDRGREVAAREQQTVQERQAAARALLATLQEEERRRAEAARAEAARAAAAQRTSPPEGSVLRQRDTARASRSAPRSAPRGSASPAGGGSCPASGGRGAEAGLTPAALTVMRCGLAAFPEVPSARGRGNRGNATDHDDGRAVDFMIPRYRTSAGNDLGWRIAEWASTQPDVEYVIFDRMMLGSWSSGGWREMGNRGSDTANHRDHVHVSVRR